MAADGVHYFVYGSSTPASSEDDHIFVRGVHTLLYYVPVTKRTLLR